jgi:hypothetical protein
MGSKLVLKTMALKSIESKKNLPPYHLCETLNPIQLGKCFKDVYGKYLLSF